MDKALLELIDKATKALVPFAVVDAEYDDVPDETRVGMHIEAGAFREELAEITMGSLRQVGATLALLRAVQAQREASRG